MEKRNPARRGSAFYEGLLAERERDGLSYQALSERTGVPLSSLQRTRLVTPMIRAPRA